ncbi:MAG TPA: Uma2 family endonuclease [Ktedonobacterales bacterium]|jgi:Uma2 family endonuclease
MMQHETLTLWGEVVTDAPYPMSFEEFERLPDDGWHYELVRGRLIRMPPPGGQHAKIAAKLMAALLTYAEQSNLGDVLGEMGFRLQIPGESKPIELEPDISFVRTGRAPAPDSPEYPKAWSLAPDLTVEIASPDQYRPEMAEKARQYLAAGVRIVWVLWPKRQQVDVWRAGYDIPIDTLALNEALDGLEVLPGFSYPLSKLF